MTAKAVPKGTPMGTPRGATKGTTKDTTKDTTEGTPREDFQPKTDAEAAMHAIQVAEGAETVGDPVPIASVHPLGTGLVDYGMWVGMFSRTAPVEASRPYRRGRIWA